MLLQAINIVQGEYLTQTVFHFQIANQVLSRWGFDLMSTWSGVRRSNQRTSQPVEIVLVSAGFSTKSFFFNNRSKKDRKGHMTLCDVWLGVVSFFNWLFGRAGNILSTVLRQKVVFLTVRGMALFSFFEVYHLVGIVNRDISFFYLSALQPPQHTNKYSVSPRADLEIINS